MSGCLAVFLAAWLDIHLHSITITITTTITITLPLTITIRAGPLHGVFWGSQG
jgi:hypothetical protein